MAGERGDEDELNTQQTVSGPQLSRILLLDIKGRRVRQLATETNLDGSPKVVRAGRGRYALIPSFQGYLRSVLERQSGEGEEGGVRLLGLGWQRPPGRTLGRGPSDARPREGAEIAKRKDRASERLAGHWIVARNVRCGGIDSSGCSTGSRSRTCAGAEPDTL